MHTKEVTTMLTVATASEGLEIAELVGMIVALVLMAALLVVDLNYIRRSRKLAKELGLPQGQWLRPVKTLLFDPTIEVLVVGVLLGKDMVQNWQHLVVALIGAVIGLFIGHYRYRIQYVKALPEYTSIVFVRSRAEYTALALLALVSIASEQHEIPVVGALTLLITLGLAIVVFESIARSWFSYRRYTQDVAAHAG
ncbi:MAG: hypothetical protein H6526_02095 [Actinobacteria bacterium]|nr:hypothetical protein [Actinomycetota bacterium]MCB9414052.1 hypothetical protein [Actinomycetota bacterium]HRY08594.1 hypothetical protein [Candidatus Nanopelagicales bacterium]